MGSFTKTRFLNALKKGIFPFDSNHLVCMANKKHLQIIRQGVDV